MKKWLITIVALILIVGGGTTWYVTAKGKSQAITIINQTATVKKGTIESKVSGSGSLEPATDKDITVSESKTVDEILVSKNDTVKKGDELLSYTDGTELDAPADGTITSLSVYDGSRVNAGQTVAHLTNYQSLNTVIQVDELDIPEVKVGQSVNVTVNAFPDKTYTGKVTAIAKEGTVNNGVSTFDVTVHLTSSKNLKAGMTTTAEIITSKKDNVLYVPVDAVHKNGATSYVLVSEANSNNDVNDNVSGVKQVKVETGTHNDSYVEIKSGLQEGQVVQLPQIERSQSNSSSSDKQQMTPGGGGFGGGFGQGTFRNGGGNFGGRSGGQGGMGGNR
ncbi:hypothetical protein GCM10011391_10670 [Pullulanibacillus camelliae]|uniref:Efflux RND transporter periplasmic adaptor subunit n=1 Tax=Pullulanibacillus camelliae TaxID=1707096 RepID=A0A8J2VNG3_9BACL|nr:efflux RND transporter periplasmic adaptor subunit [Pullulanibacillus camelliae]GGE33845.1 hypothetical protein GCM10011391_10670 [Pullulanibacillus camelliae]